MVHRHDRVVRLPIGGSRPGSDAHARGGAEVHHRSRSPEGPPNPGYPRQAVKNRIGGQVILQIAVELDGSTTVVRVVKSLPYCNVAAIEHAWKWRWTPAVKDGELVRALGIITVSFNIFNSTR